MQFVSKLEGDHYKKLESMGFRDLETLEDHASEQFFPCLKYRQLIKKNNKKEPSLLLIPQGFGEAGVGGAQRGPESGEE
jgi:hypothetical protein